MSNVQIAFDDIQQLRCVIIFYFPFQAGFFSTGKFAKKIPQLRILGVTHSLFGIIMKMFAAATRVVALSRHSVLLSTRGA
jgi:hypothetical protein